jgi:hypothetical protein
VRDRIAQDLRENNASMVFSDTQAAFYPNRSNATMTTSCFPPRTKLDLRGLKTTLNTIILPVLPFPTPTDNHLNTLNPIPTVTYLADPPFPNRIAVDLKDPKTSLGPTLDLHLLHLHQREEDDHQKSARGKNWPNMSESWKRNQRGSNVKRGDRGSSLGIWSGI